MKKDEAIHQFCKMTGEIACWLGKPEYGVCVCGEGIGVHSSEVPDEIIEEMWRRLTDPVWWAPKERG